MSTPAQVQAQALPRSSTNATLCLLMGWLIPGAGHFMLRKPIRGTLIFLSILTMFAVGLGLQGKIYAPNTGDLLDILGFVGQLGTGILYLLAKMFDWGQTSVTIALLIFALCLSVVFGITQRAQPRMMIRFGLFTFAACVFGAIAASWAMYFIKR